MSRIHIPSLLLAAAALWGCTAPEESDNPFTRFRGDVFQTVQLEVDDGGDLLVMTRSGMVYEYEGEEPAQAGTTRTRNSHSVLYRRTKGSWNATPFRNIQQEWTSLPALVPDAEGRYNAFIRDAGKILRYRSEGAEWVRAPEGRLESTVDVILGGRGNDLRTIALKDDSSVVFCRWDREEGVEVHGVAGIHGSFIMDTNQNIGINEIRAMPGFIGVLGNKNVLSREGTWEGTNLWRSVYWYWPPDDTMATTVILPDSNYEQVCFAPYRNGLGILLVLKDGFYLQPLSSEGTPQERLFLAARNFREMAQDTDIMDTPKPGAASEGGDTRPQSFSQVEVDAKGCVHVLDRRPLWKVDREGKLYEANSLYYANSCSRPREEEIPLPTDGLGDAWAKLHVADMHIDAEGKVRVAALQKTSSVYADLSFTYAPSRLLIAELGEGGWTVEIVATK